MRHDKAYKKAYGELTTTGGLKIYTTLNIKDQTAANKAVFYVLPHNNYANPNHDVDTEVMVQPGTGYIKAIAINRHYGFGPKARQHRLRGQHPIRRRRRRADRFVIQAVHAGHGTEAGHTFRLHAEGARPGGFAGPFYNCKHEYVPPFQVHNSDGGEGGTIPLYFGTTASINAFYVSLEAHVGLCNVVKTAISHGRDQGRRHSLLKWIGKPA